MPARQRAQVPPERVRDRRLRDGPAPRDARAGAAGVRRRTRPRLGYYEAGSDPVRRDLRRVTQVEDGPRG